MITIGEGVLLDPCLWQKREHYVLITDTTVDELYGKKLEHFFNSHQISFEKHLITPGENSKTMETAADLLEKLTRAGHTNKITFVSLGGGVVSDLTGFVASIFCRGAPWICLPTTLLAMVDASIGGKTGVNVGGRKNSVGSHYLPGQIVMDLTTLKTLPEKEWNNGLVECYKHYVLFDPERFNQPPEPIQQLIEKNIELKCSVVAKDAKGQKERHLLNFGHTVGHAVESLLNWNISHGEAVAFGIIVECKLSTLMGVLPPSSYEAIKKRFGSFASFPKLTAEILFSEMVKDKKSIGKMPQFTLLEEIGKPRCELTPIPQDLLCSALA